MKKRILSLLLAVMMMAALIVPASAADDLLIMPINAQVTALAPALAAAQSHYAAQTTLNSWADVLAAFSVDAELTADAPAEDLGSLTGQAAAVLTRLSAGKSVYTDGLALKVLEAQKADGSFGVYLNEQIYAMLALEAAQTPGYDAKKAQSYLLSQQLPDGGFAYFGDAGDVDLTGMALWVLTDEAAIQRAADFLVAQMTENGGYISPWSDSGLENACSVAMAVSGLLTAGQDVPELLLANLRSFQLEDGSFCFEPEGGSDVFATQQAVTTLGELVNGSVYARLSVPMDVPLYRDYGSVASWAQDAVLLLNEKGIMLGDDTQRFNPKQAITKAELAAMLVRLDVPALKSVPDVKYTDVSANRWFAESVSAVTTRGHMFALTADKFEPNKRLTRAEAAFWLANALDLAPADNVEIADLDKAPEQFRAGIQSMAADGLMLGTGGDVFAVNQLLTRQELAVIVARLYE